MKLRKSKAYLTINKLQSSHLSLSKSRDWILFDVGIPTDYGGDPGPPGSGLMMQCGLAEGIGKNLPFAQLYANHTAAIQTGKVFENFTKENIKIFSGNLLIKS